MTTFLFDMDGTLFDTEKYYNRAWKQAISDSGYELPEEEVLKLRSLGRPFAFGMPEYFSNALSNLYSCIFDVSVTV